MLSYQHIYHAGSFADVHKHALLCSVLSAVRKKPGPLTYVETHAGRGLYDLTAAEAQRNKEHESGLNKLTPLLAYVDGAPAGVQPYLRALSRTQANFGATVYPSALYLASQLMMARDKLFGYELHPGEFEHLQSSIGKDRRLRLKKTDGMAALGSNRWPEDHRLVVHIDPSYELKFEYSDVMAAARRFAATYTNAVVCVWYPILAGKPQFEQQLLKEVDRTPYHHHRLVVGNVQTGKGMVGSGFVVLNGAGVADALASTVEALEELFG